MSGKKQENPPDENYRCARCWSQDKINLFPKSQFVEDAKGFVILCERCRGEAPSGKDENIFEKLFLRFASLKEFIQFYDSENEKDAMEKWNLEMAGKEPVLVETPSTLKNIEGNTAIEDQITQIGYDVVDHELVINKDQAEMVREIFNLYLEGKTMEKIAREINKKESAINWSLAEVRETLKDPTYAGYKFRGTEIIKAEHEAIIDVETFNKVQHKIVRNIRNPKYVYKPLELGD